jgi:uncharacterized protein YcgI (DUF1989 family)
MKEYIIQSRSGMHLHLSNAQSIRLIDIEGQQVLDFFAVSARNPNEILSPGVTIDCNGSLNVSKNDCLYSNLYSKMLLITEDSVGKHDLIHPCCRPEMYDYFYGNGEDHPNCLENINNLLEELGLSSYSIIHPFNVFMNTKVEDNGKIEVLAPQSKPNDFIELKALMDLNLFLAACSVSESSCNGGKCTPIRAIVNP